MTSKFLSKNSRKLDLVISSHIRGKNSPITLTLEIYKRKGNRHCPNALSPPNIVVELVYYIVFIVVESIQTDARATLSILNF